MKYNNNLKLTAILLDIIKICYFLTKITYFRLKSKQKIMKKNNRIYKMKKVFFLTNVNKNLDNNVKRKPRKINNAKIIHKTL